MGDIAQPPAMALKPLAEVHRIILTSNDPVVRDEAGRVARDAYLKSRDFASVNVTFVRKYLEGDLDLCALTPLSSVSWRPPYSASHETWLWKLRRLKLVWDRCGPRHSRIEELGTLMQELEDLQALAAKVV